MNRPLRVEALEVRTLLTASPWQNVDQPLDTNNDDYVSPIDLLVIVNYLNAPGAAEVETASTPNPLTYPDVNGDSAVTPDDASLVTTYLNSTPPTTSPPPPDTTYTTPMTPPPPPPDPCASVPHPSVTIDTIPSDVDEMEVFTVSGSMPNANYAQVDMGDAWVQMNYYYDASAFTWTMTGYYNDDTGSGTANDPRTVSVLVGNICYQASTSAGLTVHNVDPSLDSITTSGTVDEGSEASVTVTFSDAVSVSNYSSDEWTIVIDWGDGTSSTHQAGGSYYGSYPTMPGMPNYNSLTATHVYVDDDPTGTSSDTYTVTMTITDDDTGTDSATASITVNNVAPTVTINSITAIDKVLAVDADGNATDWLNPGQLDESEGFIVRGTVTDAGVNDTHTATLKVDLNFDGDTDDAGESVAVAVTPVPNTPGHWTFEHTVSEVPDDGPSPGNDTSSDALTLTFAVVDDDNGQGTDSYTADVTNVPPHFLGQPSVSFETAPDGTLLSVTLEGDLFEQNPNDVLELEIIWGDGEEGDGTTNPIQVSSGSFSITRSLSSSPGLHEADLYPVLAHLRDDDQGEAVAFLAQSACKSHGMGRTSSGKIADLDKGLNGTPHKDGADSWREEYGIKPEDIENFLGRPINYKLTGADGNQRDLVSALFYVWGKVECPDTSKLDVEVWESRKVEVYDRATQKWVTAPDAALKGGSDITDGQLEKLKKGEQIKVLSGFGNNVSNTETADKTKYPKANRFILVTDFPTHTFRYPDIMTRMSVKQTVIIKCDGKDLDRFTHTFDLGWEITKPGAKPGAKKFLKFT